MSFKGGLERLIRKYKLTPEFGYNVGAFLPIPVLLLVYIFGVPTE